MKLYIGGACQGQEDLARGENPSAEIIADFHLLLKDFGGDPRAFEEGLIRGHLQHRSIVVSKMIIGALSEIRVRFCDDFNFSSVMEKPAGSRIHSKALISKFIFL